MVFSDPPYYVPIAGHVSGLGKIQHREFAMASVEMSDAEFTAFLKTVNTSSSASSSRGMRPTSTISSLANSAPTARIYGPMQVSTALAMAAQISSFIQRSNRWPSLRMRYETARVAKASC